MVFFQPYLSHLSHKIQKRMMFPTFFMGTFSDPGIHRDPPKGRGSDKVTRLGRTPEAAADSAEHEGHVRTAAGRPTAPVV